MKTVVWAQNQCLNWLNVQEAQVEQVKQMLISWGIDEAWISVRDDL